MSTKIRTYTELSELSTFQLRFEYLSLRSEVGQSTFGFDRWINQQFYTSRQWRQLRQKIILRDNSCDLGLEGYDIHTKLIVHHMNPLREDDITYGTRYALDPEYLICTTHDTHNAIHFGDASLLAKPFTPRRPGDTKLW
jgi:5-methylcytosine-specific restriction endonuclease McrA